MLAVIERDGNGYIARFERRYKHAVDKVWAALTDNEQLGKWFPELSVEDLRTGGRIRFDMRDGTFVDMNILDCKPLKALEYTWGSDTVRFELYPDGAGCRLLLLERLNGLTDHTPKDLAGWHVCLDVITVILDGSEPQGRKANWEIQFAAYQQLLAAYRQL
ncbi:SRPBCC family protein [Paenibacillus athensensis]|uniref:Activator of Hsp90 ATPase 1 family protein n=1 Tax=Paenibacillus athensensis TaxID=1967502 RepID=A0A4Y8Q3K8_9BACL|nr:SRPBCC family protein [Paenibacillus athensensis]MCD1258387.1 SRPBCC family protein [Paenibacillus athensensis]